MDHLFLKFLSSKNTPYRNDQPLNIDDAKSATTHASQNVLAHSWWTAEYIHQWFIEKDPWTRGLNQRLAVICGFFHDIAKASECNKSCVNKKCWIDAYAAKNYGGKGDRVHPWVSGMILLGKLPFVSNCKTGETLDIPKLLTEMKVNPRIVALTAFMHWSFGQINADLNHDPPYSLMNPKDYQAFRKYLDEFFEACKICDLQPEPCFMRLCLLISRADMFASSRTEVGCDSGVRLLDKACSKISPLQLQMFYQNYVDTWTKYRMNIRASAIYNKLVTLIKMILSETDTTER